MGDLVSVVCSATPRKRSLSNTLTNTDVIFFTATCRKQGFVVVGAIILGNRDINKDFAHFVDGMGVSAWLTDDNGIIDYCNHRALDLTK